MPHPIPRSSRSNGRGAIMRSGVLTLNSRTGSAEALASFDRARATFEVQAKADPGKPKSGEALRRVTPVSAVAGRWRAIRVVPPKRSRGRCPSSNQHRTSAPKILQSLPRPRAARIGRRRRSSKLTAEEGQAQAETALATLSRAISLGYRDATRMRTDADFNVLRARLDFQLILMDMAMPKDPLCAGR